MATAVHSVPALLTLEEYLQTSYRPDRDFVDGVTEERNVGGTKHGLLQMQLGFWFINHQKEWRIRVIGELRTQVSGSKVRLPDVAVVADDDALHEELRTTPPLIAIEIKSPDDRMSRVVIRLKDFRAMGVPNIWLLDPEERIAYTYTHEGLKLVETDRISLPDSPIYLDLAALFSALD